MRSFKFLALLAFLAIFAAPQAQAQVSPSNYSYNDCSIASLSGASQQILAANPQRRALIIINNGSAGNAVGVNLAGGTAALNATGTMTLNQNGSYIQSSNLPQILNAITVIGTSGQSVQCWEGR